LISDLLGKRAPVLVVSLLLAMGALVGYSRKFRKESEYHFRHFLLLLTLKK